MHKIVPGAALIAAMIATALGIAVGLFVLLGPTQVRCGLPALQPGVGQLVSGNCTQVSVLEAGGVIWPRPLVPVAIWSLAPALGLIGVLRILGRRRGLWVVVVGLAIEATAIISFVAGPMFLEYVFLPLLVTTLLASLLAVSRRRGPLPEH